MDCGQSDVVVATHCPHPIEDSNLKASEGTQASEGSPSTDGLEPDILGEGDAYDDELPSADENYLLDEASESIKGVNVAKKRKLSGGEDDYLLKKASLAAQSGDAPESLWRSNGCTPHVSSDSSPMETDACCDAESCDQVDKPARIDPTLLTHTIRSDCEDINSTVDQQGQSLAADHLYVNQKMQDFTSSQPSLKTEPQTPELPVSQTQALSNSSLSSRTVIENSSAAVNNQCRTVYKEEDKNTCSDNTQQRCAATVTSTSEEKQSFRLMDKQALRAIFQSVQQQMIWPENRVVMLVERMEYYQKTRQAEERKISEILEQMVKLRERIKLHCIKPAQRTVCTQITVKQPATPCSTANGPFAEQPASQPLSSKPVAAEQKALNSIGRGSTAAPPAVSSSPASFAASQKCDARQALGDHKNDDIIDLTKEDSEDELLYPSSTGSTPAAQYPNKVSGSAETIHHTVAVPPTIPALSPIRVPPAVLNGAVSVSHPIPLPEVTRSVLSNERLPIPTLLLFLKRDGLCLQWNIPNLTKYDTKVVSYQIFAYKEKPGPASDHTWKKVGDLKALPLPMACTLTQFQVGNRYHFAVRAVDDKNHIGKFSAPRSIYLS